MVLGFAIIGHWMSFQGQQEEELSPSPVILRSIGLPQIFVPAVLWEVLGEWSELVGKKVVKFDAERK